MTRPEQHPTACAAPDCDRPARSRGLCSMHYQRDVYRAGLTADDSTASASGHASRKPDAGYHAAHERCFVDRGPASRFKCADCGEPAHEWALHPRAVAERQDERGRAYSLQTLWDYIPLCRSCHRRIDPPTNRVRGHESAEAAAMLPGTDWSAYVAERPDVPRVWERLAEAVTA